ncbi:MULTISPECIES: DUF4097 family beta strand repeat-containing protein [Spirosoma]|uniref:DUF4097 domain-containing protein n=1 Tax=Spirosoma liriopis TaxID=2937440 RepID=A0ABT0HU38_9BACT|nr:MULTISPECIES: hypothetical protein [Spirosoma]MCK8495676.1 hypothetical protein [Spirosoma liriopis]UHG91370.1 hypothetical protein LQ777_00370 [Spirosoma oryzicola]
MKSLLIPCLTGLVLACAQSPVHAQEFRERVTKEFTAPNGGTLAIYNINGFIKVEGYSGDKVVLSVDKTITAKDKDVLETGKKEFKVDFEQRGDSIIAYIAEPFDSRPNRSWKNQNHDRRIEYDFTLNFTVKIPYKMNLHASTVNRGNIDVKDVSGSLKVTNVNGAITLVNAKGATDAHTINGDVVINYLVSPPDKSSYYTLNGAIRVSYPANLSADLQFKSFQGEFYTDFPNAEVLPTQVTKNQERRGEATVYKLTKNTAIRIGGGGKTFRFETFNGNIYIKKQS